MTLFTQLVAILLLHTVSASSMALAEPTVSFQLAASQESDTAAASRDEPLRTRQFASGSVESTTLWQQETRLALSKLLKMDDLLEHARLKMAPKVLAEKPCDGYRRIDLEIASTATRRIPIVVTIPDGAGPFPAVVCIHGHGGNRNTPYDDATIYKGFGTALAPKGYVTVSVDVGQHEVYEPGRTLMGERLWDLIRCVDYLESLPEVDPMRIGCAGLSLGGEMVMWLAAMDTRIRAASSCGFLTLMDQMEQNHCMCWKFPGLRELVDYPDIYALIAPRPLQCQNGEQEPPDSFTPALARTAMDQIRPAYAVFGATGKVELHIHPGAHEIDLDPLVAFMDAHLHN